MGTRDQLGEYRKIFQDKVSYDEMLKQHHQPEIDRYGKDLENTLNKSEIFLIEKTLEENHEQYIKEIRDVKILGETGTWNYIGIFIQKDPQKSMLSLRKSVDLGTAFKSVGAEIDGAIKYDKFDNHFKQFILLDKEGNIYWWYRFSNLANAIKEQKKIKNNENAEKQKTNQTNTPMGEYFNFAPQWIEENKESTIELGTAYINKELANIYTMSDNIKALGMMINKYNNKKYLGKMTIPTKELYNKNAADLAIYYLEEFFKDKNNSLTPKDNYIYTIDQQKKETFDGFIKEYELSGNWKNDEKKIRKLFMRNKNIFWNTKRFPWMFGTYLGMSPKFTYYGAIKNPDGTVEAGITIDTETVDEDFREKYIEITKDTIKDFQKKDWTQYTLWEKLAEEEQAK